MERINEVAEIQSILLNILKYFKEFCTEHNLEFFLSNGTLLGAVKYNGFIPWDDDVDIMMPRGDYDRFLSLFDNSGRYKLLSGTTTKSWRMPYSKLTDTMTVLTEKGYDFGEELGISIDIFPIDKWHPNKVVAYIQSIYCELLKRFLVCSIGSENPSLPKGIKSFILFLVWKTGKMLGHRKIYKLIEKRINKSKKYRNRYCGCVAWCCHSCGEVLQDSVFSDKKFIRFEDDIYPAPIGSEEYLTKLYGKWKLDLPPEKQKSNHVIEAWKTDE